MIVTMTLSIFLQIKVVSHDLDRRQGMRISLTALQQE